MHSRDDLEEGGDLLCTELFFDIQHQFYLIPPVYLSIIVLATIITFMLHCSCQKRFCKAVAIYVTV